MHKTSQPQLPIITITVKIIWVITERCGWPIQERLYNAHSITQADCPGPVMMVITRESNSVNTTARSLSKCTGMIRTIMGQGVLSGYGKVYECGSAGRELL